MTEQRSSQDDGLCICGNRFDGDNLCMRSACQWEGVSAGDMPSSQPGDLIERLYALEDRLAVVSKERDDAREEAKLNGDEADNLFARVGSTEAEREALRSALTAVKIARDRLEAERDDARDERDHYERQGSDTLAEWDKMRVERDRLQAELDELRADIARRATKFYPDLDEEPLIFVEGDQT